MHRDKRRTLWNKPVDRVVVANAGVRMCLPIAGGALAIPRDVGRHNVLTPAKAGRVRFLGEGRARLFLCLGIVTCAGEGAHRL
jgi:hypothetical protein